MTTAHDGGGLIDVFVWVRARNRRRRYEQTLKEENKVPSNWTSNISTECYCD